VICKLNPQGKNSWYTLNMRLDGPRIIFFSIIGGVGPSP
jgi:hypothetical protein